ncbi:MAG: ATP-binding cassette domain-containing protein [Sphingobium sp.]
MAPGNALPATGTTAVPAAIATSVCKSFGGLRALDKVDISIEPGRMTGLVGPDGAGKTTLIRILAGLMKADAGDIHVLGGAPGDDLENLGYMPQRFGLYEDLSVIQNLTLYADMRRLEGAERQESFDRLLHFTDLTPFRDRLAGNLSGGMKQKLGLACALIKTPKLLLLDEPGVGVDPISRRELWSMVSGLTHQGIGVLWSTAYLDEAEKCDTVYLLNEGQLLYSGKPDGLNATVEGRTLRLSGFSDRSRPLLIRALDSDTVMDGTLQGRAIHLLMAPDKGPDDLDFLDAGQKTKIEIVPPHFEDGFIARLGGGPKGTSELAERYRTVPQDRDYAIEARKLTKRFGSFTASDAIEFKIPPGRIFGLLGPNGAGKSTTFKMLCGLLTPTEGTGSVAGYDLMTARADARAQLGYMAQKFSLYGELSVKQNLNFFAGAYGLKTAAARAAIASVVEVFELGDRLKVDAGTLPLGFKQRLALACAVLHQPPVLFLDEPTSGVDPVTRREFWMHINGLVEKGVTVLVTTHFMEEAEYCDEITLVYRAKQIATGTPDDLKAQSAKLSGLADPTMEDAFIALINEHDRQEAEGPGSKAA